ncbi:retrovirus-related pol polyprotein from transposon TNT 1-94 [Tanacetum coccineum]
MIQGLSFGDDDMCAITKRIKGQDWHLRIAVGFTYADTMDDMNIPANDVPAKQAPTISPPTRTDDQILPIRRWVPIGKSNYVLDVLKAFTASSTIPAIYIQQFWDTMRYDSTTRIYSCQVDEQWFNLHKHILRDALQITPINDDNPFVAPPSSDAVIEYVNTLGYPCTLRNVSAMFVRKDGREVFGMPIPAALLTDAIKRAPYYGGYLAHVAEYQQHLDGEHAPTKPSQAVPEKKQKLVKETPDESSPATRSKASLVGKKRKPKSPLKLVDEFADEGVPMSEPRIVDEEADYQRAVELSLKDLEAKTQGPARTMVIHEPDSGRFQPLPEVQGKGKEKVIEEQAARDLLTLQTSKKQSPADQFIFQRRTPTTTEPSRNVESPSSDAELAIADSETESDEEVTPVNKEKDASNMELTEINAGVQDEGQTGSDPGKQDEGQAGSNPGNAAVFQPQPSHVVHAGPNLEPMDLAVSDSSTQQNPEQLDEDFTDQFFVEKPQKEEPEKTNAELEVQSMVMVPIHQDASSVPPMTTPVIDLTTSQVDSPIVHAPLPTSTATTTIIKKTTTLPPPPLQPQHSTTDQILIRRISKLKQHMENLIQDNSALEEKLNKQGSYLYNLENLNIPQKVSKAIDEIVTNAVDWALQAPLRDRFRDLPKADIRKDWWKPLPEEEERLATPEPAWTIPSSNVSDVENNWASALVSTYEPPAENSLLVKTGDMTTFMN